MRPAPFWFLEACRPGFRAAARGLFRIRFEGVEHVPRSGPVVITPNHVSFMDPILVTIPIRRALHYMALEPFFRIRGLGAVMRWARAFPIQEGEPDSPAVRRALRNPATGGAARDLSRGPPVARWSASRPFRPGAFRLALATGAPVVPVTLAGAFEAWPMGRRLPRPGRIVVTYHAPLDGSALPPDADRKARPELLMALARERIAVSPVSLSGGADRPAPSGTGRALLRELGAESQDVDRRLPGGERLLDLLFALVNQADALGHGGDLLPRTTTTPSSSPATRSPGRTRTPPHWIGT